MDDYIDISIEDTERMDSFDDDFNTERWCDCGKEAGDECTLCGYPMCYMCSELSGGVCDHHKF